MQADQAGVPKALVDPVLSASRQDAKSQQHAGVSWHGSRGTRFARLPTIAVTAGRPLIPEPALGISCVAPTAADQPECRAH